jgi:DNA invertase Pin-like site-specific DNA recombinase
LWIASAVNADGIPHRAGVHQAVRLGLAQLSLDHPVSPKARPMEYPVRHERLGRSLTHLALMLDELNRLKVLLIASSQGIDTSEQNPAGRLQLGVMMAVAEFERGIIKERVKAGVAAAKARGVRLGRPPRLKARAPEVMKLRGQGLGIRAIARSLDMPVSSIHSLVEWTERGWAAIKESAHGA